MGTISNVSPPRGYPPGDLVREFAVKAIGDRLKEALENFRDTMKTGDAKLGVPVLDPLDLDHQQINIAEDVVTVDGEVNDVHVEGLSSYTVEHADFKISKWNVSLDLLWSNIKGKTAYDINGLLLGKLPLYGAGEASVNVDNFRFATQAKLKVNAKEKKVKIVSFNATAISLGKLKVDVTGLYYNEEFSSFLSAAISDIVPDGINDFQEEIVAEVNKILLVKANELLDDISLDDILGLIS